MNILISLIQGYRLYFLLFIGAAGTFAWLTVMRERLNMKVYAAAVISILHVTAGVFCVKAFAVLEGNPAGNGAMSLFGAVFFMPVFYFAGAKLFRRDTGTVFDIFTIPMVFTLFCARINCLFAGCCLGKHVFGQTFRYPTRELELIFYAVFITYAAVKIIKKQTNGYIYPLYMTAYGIFRFIVEFFRESSNSAGSFHISHIWAGIAIAVGAGFYFELMQISASK